MIAGWPGLETPLASCKQMQPGSLVGSELWHRMCSPGEVFDPADDMPWAAVRYRTVRLGHNMHHPYAHVILNAWGCPDGKGLLQGAEIWFIWGYWDKDLWRLSWYAGPSPKRCPNLCRLGCRLSQGKQSAEVTTHHVDLPSYGHLGIQSSWTFLS